jgi:hypothetical protein
MIRKHAPDAVLAVFETGPLATSFRRKLTADGGMHRRACEGGTRYGAKQDRRQRRRSAVLVRGFFKTAHLPSASKQHQTPVDEGVAIREPKCFTRNILGRLTLAATGQTRAW